MEPIHKERETKGVYMKLSLTLTGSRESTKSSPRPVGSLPPEYWTTKMSSLPTTWQKHLHPSITESKSRISWSTKRWLTGIRGIEKRSVMEILTCQVPSATQGSRQVQGALSSCQRTSNYHHWISSLYWQMRNHKLWLLKTLTLLRHPSKPTSDK